MWNQAIENAQATSCDTVSAADIFHDLRTIKNCIKHTNDPVTSMDVLRNDRYVY